MNKPWIYMCSPSRSPLPSPSPSHPSGSSQCTRPEHLSHASILGWWSVSPLIKKTVSTCSISGCPSLCFFLIFCFQLSHTSNHSPFFFYSSLKDSLSPFAHSHHFHLWYSNPNFPHYWITECSPTDLPLPSFFSCQFFSVLSTIVIGQHCAPVAVYWWTR